jgi:hypothetical protein
MFSENNHGDSGSVGLELLASITEIEERARVVEQAVAEGYFGFQEALTLYKVTEREYMAYLLLKRENSVPSKQVQFFEMLSSLVKMYHDASKGFDADAKKLVTEIEVFTREHHYHSY